jgi:hypothetical protein
LFDYPEIIRHIARTVLLGAHRIGDDPSSERVARQRVSPGIHENLHHWQSCMTDGVSKNTVPAYARIGIRARRKSLACMLRVVCDDSLVKAFIFSPLTPHLNTMHHHNLAPQISSLLRIRGFNGYCQAVSMDRSSFSADAFPWKIGGRSQRN